MPKDLTDKKEKKRKEKKEAAPLADEPSAAAEDVDMEEGESVKVREALTLSPWIMPFFASYIPWMYLFAIGDPVF